MSSYHLPHVLSYADVAYSSAPQESPNHFNLFPRPIIHLGLNLYFQTAIKYILTQGDSLLIAYLTTLSTQGAYALASNYGGLIARMLFQPLEDTSRNLFAKLCSTPPAKSSTTQSTETTTSSPSKANLAQAALFLTTLLKFYALLSLSFFALGPPLSPHLLALIAGTRWTSTGAGAVLATYCYYIPLLALNGVTEAFVAATASTSQLRTQSLSMTAWFFAFAGVAYILLGPLDWGAEGLVWANVVNMSLRIVWNVRFVQAFFGRFGAELKLVAALPEWGSVAASVAVGAILRARMRESAVGEGVLGQLVRGGSVAVVLVAIVAVSERRFLLGVYAMVRGMSGKEEKDIAEKTAVERKSD
jgi:oligosaccharide translocation protein RFT1